MLDCVRLALNTLRVFEIPAPASLRLFPCSCQVKDFKKKVFVIAQEMCDLISQHASFAFWTVQCSVLPGRCCHKCDRAGTPIVVAGVLVTDANSYRRSQSSTRCT